MGNWLYNDAMYRFGEAQPSYWEQSVDEAEVLAPQLLGEEACDVAIIGAGYTGLSAAYHLAKDHQLDVRVLEAGHIGWGASGRNGGFCSVGGAALDAESMVRKYGVEDTRAYYAAQVEAIGLVRDIILKEKIDAQMQGDGELSIAVSQRNFEQLRAYAELQFRVLGLDTQVIERDELSECYLDSPLQYGGAILRPTFGLHPLRYLRGLAAASIRLGAKLYARSEVVNWSREDGVHCLRTNAGSLRAKRVIVATNAFMPEHLHTGLRGRVLPMISSIVVTRPLNQEELSAHRWRTECPTITSVRLLNYFRVLPDGRLLFGGRGSADGSERSARQNFADLTERLHELFPLWRDVEIEFRWHGLVCMTRRMTPAIGQFADDSSAFFAFGYHGNGVNTATWAGRKVAEWVGTNGSGNTIPPASLPLMVREMPDAFPLSSLRLVYARSAITACRISARIKGEA